MNESMSNREFIVQFSAFVSLIDCKYGHFSSVFGILTLFNGGGTTNFKKRLPIFVIKNQKTTNKNLTMY